MGYFNGDDKDFSFSDVYAPIDFGAARFCEARVWSMFRKVNSSMDIYENYAMGYDLSNRMPLYIKPERKLSVKDLIEFKRDYLQGTKYDMTQDIGAGPWGGLPYRWRPLTWEVDGKTYIHERVTVTQQTAFSFITQSRRNYPDHIGVLYGLEWTMRTQRFMSQCMPVSDERPKPTPKVMEAYSNILKVPHSGLSTKYRTLPIYDII